MWNRAVGFGDPTKHLYEQEGVEMSVVGLETKITQLYMFDENMINHFCWEKEFLFYYEKRKEFTLIFSVLHMQSRETYL